MHGSPARLLQTSIGSYAFKPHAACFLCEGSTCNQCKCEAQALIPKDYTLGKHSPRNRHNLKLLGQRGSSFDRQKV